MDENKNNWLKAGFYAKKGCKLCDPEVIAHYPCDKCLEVNAEKSKNNQEADGYIFGGR